VLSNAAQPCDLSGNLSSRAAYAGSLCDAQRTAPRSDPPTPLGRSGQRWAPGRRAL